MLKKFSLVLLLSLSLSACSPSSSDMSAAETPSRSSVDLSTYVSASQVASDFMREEKSLVLSPTWSWPKEVSYPSKGPDGNQQHYAPDFGKSRAQAYWFCSWGDYVLSAGEHGRVRGIDELESVKYKHFFKVNMDEKTRADIVQEVEGAKLGSYDALRADISANCAKGEAT